MPSPTMDEVQPLLQGNRLDFISWDTIGKRGIKIKRGADRLGGIGPVSRQHDDARDARVAKRTDGPRGFPPQFIRK